jgi:3-oxoacyl-[acyl-carrier protein] reductase
MAVTEAGGADFLVNDAGAYPDGTLRDMPLEDWQLTWRVNVTGTFLMSQAFVRHRPSGVPGAIVNISSGSARSPRPNGGAYAASKAAIEVLTRAHAMELGPSGINVNAVAPGYIDVRGYTDVFPDRASDSTRKALVEASPLGRAGRHQDIAAAVLFLCSKEASYITGTTLDVDGGQLAGRFHMPGMGG